MTGYSCISFATIVGVPRRIYGSRTLRISIELGTRPKRLVKVRSTNSTSSSVSMMNLAETYSPRWHFEQGHFLVPIPSIDCCRSRFSIFMKTMIANSKTDANLIERPLLTDSP